MTKPVFRVPFVSLIAKVVLFVGVGILVAFTAISYAGIAALEDSIEGIHHTNADLRVELARLESEVAAARLQVERVMAKERILRDKSESLRQQALQLERDWETVRVYRRRVERSGREIEEIRQRIHNLGR
jgi:archaellum component FlaC